MVSLTSCCGDRLLSVSTSSPIYRTAGQLDGTDHATCAEQASMIRRYIIWPNKHACDERLRRIIDRANVA
jgi:hypothetical protein